MLGLITAWPSVSWRTKPLHIFYVAMMFFASMYLDHHWIVDAIAGWLTVWVAALVARRVLARLSSSQGVSLTDQETHAFSG
jgi:membrane-associated phospholipid phosphatase